jgi:hypothetical protein
VPANVNHQQSPFVKVSYGYCTGCCSKLQAFLAAQQSYYNRLKAWFKQALFGKTTPRVTSSKSVCPKLESPNIIAFSAQKKQLSRVLKTLSHSGALPKFCVFNF